MHLPDTEQYISFDVESTGPCPGLYSMIDVAFVDVRDFSNNFTASLVELPTAKWHPDTRKFWMKNSHNRHVLEVIESRAQPIVDVVQNYTNWLRQFPKPVFVGYPAAWDFQWLNYYHYLTFPNDTNFAISALDIKTLMLSALQNGWRNATKKNLKRKFPQVFDNSLPHTHFGLDDAIEQANMFNELVKIL